MRAKKLEADVVEHLARLLLDDPQCPWLMYSQRHTSVTTSSSGAASFIARVASWTIPSVS